VVRSFGSDHIGALRDHNYGHVKAKELLAAMPTEEFDSFYKFAFVRNPWDWQVSIYHYVTQCHNHPDHELFVRFGSFERYLEWRLNSRGPELQSEFVLSDAGELLVDFVGHYESLRDDFAAVCARVGAEARFLVHENRSQHRGFRDYYTDETRAIVADAYKDDIDFFGYDFHGSRLLQPMLGPAERERMTPVAVAPGAASHAR